MKTSSAERKLFTMKLNKILKTIQVLVFLTILGCKVSYAAAQDTGCLWKESSSVTSKEPTVMNMRTDCSRGKILWLNPYGGLRSTFYPKDIERIKNKSFKLCFKTKDTGVTIFSDEYTKLKLLKSAKDEKVGQRMCVSSTGGPVVLYFETSDGSRNRSVFALTYKIIFQQKRIKQRIRKECRICSPIRMLKSLCNSDFVVKGRIVSGVKFDDDTLETKVMAEVLLGQRAKIFLRDNTSKLSSPVGSVRLPANCRWSKNKSYLFTGNIISGRGPTLGCYSEEKVWLEMQTQYIDHLCKYVMPNGKIQH